MDLMAATRTLTCPGAAANRRWLQGLGWGKALAVPLQRQTWLPSSRELAALLFRPHLPLSALLGTPLVATRWSQMCAGGRLETANSIGKVMKQGRAQCQMLERLLPCLCRHTQARPACATASTWTWQSLVPHWHTHTREQQGGAEGAPEPAHAPLIPTVGGEPGNLSVAPPRLLLPAEHHSLLQRTAGITGSRHRHRRRCRRATTPPSHSATPSALLVCRSILRPRSACREQAAGRLSLPRFCSRRRRADGMQAACYTAELEEQPLVREGGGGGQKLYVRVRASVEGLVTGRPHLL